MAGGEIKHGGFVTRTKNLSIDTDDTISSRCSTESLKPKVRTPPGTYVVKLPLNQIYRVPPPENAHRYEYLSRKKPNRSSFRRCFCCFLAAVFVLLVLAAIAVGILFFLYQPHKPTFSVSGVSVVGINLTSPSPISPVIRIKLRSRNVNEKLCFVYGNEIAAEIFYDGIELGNGKFTAFKQPPENVTVIKTALKGTSIQLTRSSRKELTDLEKKRRLPAVIIVKAQVKFKVGAVTTWAMTVTVDCKITLDKLTASASVMTENCDTSLRLF